MPAPIDAISLRVDHWNDNPKPFGWHAPADEILEKVRRGRKPLSQVKGQRSTSFSGTAVRGVNLMNTIPPPERVMAR
ncbi:hypothetical protein K6U06_03195 [Acidiferrimicrobium sp. IK]|uniref:hypothetical protein n=1 Tax=Acidiferrimicrobium sp. IK TaxID=2871700 RepID=UPI0021CB32E6|nr:hypothetical protein [Acidiferrimicrobium sp. IK]MCU4183351.1 hypothetical protein [Acidiferrimicrobium sp. IK]